MKFFLVLTSFILSPANGASLAEFELNKPELLKQIKVEKGGILQLSNEAKKHNAEGDLVLSFYCLKDSHKCELRNVAVTEKTLGKK